jgi:hypothetical protein
VDCGASSRPDTPEHHRGLTASITADATTPPIPGLQLSMSARLLGWTATRTLAADPAAYTGCIAGAAPVAELECRRPGPSDHGAASEGARDAPRLRAAPSLGLPDCPKRDQSITIEQSPRGVKSRRPPMDVAMTKSALKRLQRKTKTSRCKSWRRASLPCSASWTRRIRRR